jgi:adenylylsulfate kinase-like enzyme
MPEQTNNEIFLHDFNRFNQEQKKRQSYPGHVFWFYGLSGSGKSTIANLCGIDLIKNQNLYPIILDGDQTRNGLNKDLGFTLNDRSENIRRIAEVAKTLSQQSMIVLCCFITPLEDQRKMVKEIIKENVSLIGIDVSFKECEKRDPKKLYQNKIIQLNGENSKFDALRSFDLKINNLELKRTTEEVLNFINMTLNKKIN